MHPKKLNIVHQYYTNMGYDSIIKVASDSTIDWDEFRDECLEKFSEHEIGKEIHGCAFWDNTPLFAEISRAFPSIDFRFYYFHFDYECLTIYEYLDGECWSKKDCQPPKEFLRANGLSASGFVWNPRLTLKNEITDCFLPDD